MHAEDDDDPSIFMGEEQPAVAGPADVGHYVGALVDMLETADGSAIAQQSAEQQHRFNKQAATTADASAANILVQKQLSDERAAAAAHASAMAMLVQQQITDEQAATAADAQAADILFQKQLSERQFASASVAHGLNLKVVSAIQEIHHTAKRDHADMEHAASVAERDAKIAALTDELEFTRCEAKALSSDYLALDERRDGSMTSARLSQKLQPLLDCALQSGNLGQSDEIFLENFLTHIAKPNCPYHPLIADIAQHYSNLLGTTEYLTLARILKIPRSRSWIKEKRRDARQLIHVGTMYGQLDILPLSHDGNMFVAGGDATRATAMAEAMVDPRRNTNYLLGPCYDPATATYKNLHSPGRSVTNSFLNLTWPESSPSSAPRGSPSPSLSSPSGSCSVSRAKIAESRAGSLVIGMTKSPRWSAFRRTALQAPTSTNPPCLSFLNVCSAGVSSLQHTKLQIDRSPSMLASKDYNSHHQHRPISTNTID